MDNEFGDFVVVGGGVAGVCTVEELDSLLNTPEFASSEFLNSTIIFIPGLNGFIKKITNEKMCGQITQYFDVSEGQAQEHFLGSERIRVINDNVIGWDATRKLLFMQHSPSIQFGRLCIATGASPRHLFDHPNVLRIRDLETIGELQNRLPSARRVLILGNGGIATELAFELRNIEILWCIRHQSISATYFDEVAAKFFESRLIAGRSKDDHKSESQSSKRFSIVKFISTKVDENNMTSGCALGPHWLEKLTQLNSKTARSVHVINEIEIARIQTDKPADKKLYALPEQFVSVDDWNLWAELTNGEVVGIDLVIEATGNVPNSSMWKRDCEELQLAHDSGILVNERLETGIKDVFAAGDICTASWAENSPHWTQIRLWTQAKQMGTFCARSMLIPKERLLLDIAFDIFTHATTFFGYKVILLGDFSASKVPKPYKIHYRITEEKEYVKVITSVSRVHGAVLIGDTDLEEVIENLILNQTDISQIEDNLLDPSVDLEDFFD